MYKKKLTKSRYQIINMFSLWIIVAAAVISFTACDVHRGIFIDSAVSGLDYSIDGLPPARTDEEGGFFYRDGETVVFSIGDLVLGSADGADIITPLSITPGALSASDQRVNNKLILLQTIDADGDLNNGIQITGLIREIVSSNTASINFDQTTSAFRNSLAPLLAALNTAGVFTDTDPRPRTVRSAVSALEHFNRSTSERYVVKTSNGELKGYSATPDTWQFLGIPYAKPPIGRLRWMPPCEPNRWKGVRDAVAWSDQAAQNPSYQSFGEGGMSEDCLYLNVTTPKNAHKLPVMVWFHGGGFATLTGNTRAFNNPSSLPTKGVVLVVVNHRLGPFGYLAHPLLSEESGYGGSGNYGQMDQVAALKWIKKNIYKFGGDPGNVTIFGESGGGGKVLYLMTTPHARRLFHKAVCQSGMYPPDTRLLNAAEKEGTALFNVLGVTTLEQARGRSWLEIEAAARTTVNAIPNVDGFHIPDTMRNIYESGRQNDVPFISGMNRKDLDNPLLGFGITALIRDMPWFASNRKSETFVYVFDRVPAGWRSQGVGAYHGIELVYLFNYPGSLYSHYLLGLTGLTVDYTKTPLQVIAGAGYGAEDIAVSDIMMTMWTNFAKTGRPGTETFNWPVYTAESDAYAEIDESPEVKTGLKDAF